MIDYHKELVSELNKILPTHYEMALTAGLPTPCISYMEMNNYIISYGDKLAYSRISYQVKVWGNDISELQKYALQIDAALKPFGFIRTSSSELYDKNSTMIQKIMMFEALASETY